MFSKNQFLNRNANKLRLKTENLHRSKSIQRQYTSSFNKTNLLKELDQEDSRPTVQLQILIKAELSKCRLTIRKQEKQRLSVKTLVKKRLQAPEIGGEILSYINLRL